MQYINLHAELGLHFLDHAWRSREIGFQNLIFGRWIFVLCMHVYAGADDDDDEEDDVQAPNRTPFFCFSKDIYSRT